MEGPRVLQVSLFRLRRGASVDGIVGAAVGLARLPGVLGAGFVRAGAESESNHDLALFFLLSSRAALEEFGAGPEHVRFLRESVATNVTGVAVAEVVASAERVPAFGAGTVWMAALPDGTYDWQTAAELDAQRRAAAESGGFIALLGGPAVERSRFGAAAVLLWRDAETLEAFLAGRSPGQAAAHWQPLIQVSVAGPGGTL